MTEQEKYYAILRQHLPEAAVEWVYQFVERHHVHLTITQHRSSKHGDYRAPHPLHPYHAISVGGDLNQYMFLLVFIHEAAHLTTHLARTNEPPHGPQWQRNYATMMLQQAHLFPDDVRPLLVAYASHLPLSHKRLLQLEEAIGHYNPDYAPLPHLDDLAPGTRFRLKSNPNILFRAIERRRTRWLCLDVHSSRQYTVNGRAEVIVES